MNTVRNVASLNQIDLIPDYLNTIRRASLEKYPEPKL